MKFAKLPKDKYNHLVKITRIFLFALTAIAASLIAIKLIFKPQSQLPIVIQDIQPTPALNSLTPNESPSLPVRRVAGIVINDQELDVEVATTSAEIVRGLSGRDALDLDGILFVFPAPGNQNFWMKDIRFPIDLVWINNSKVIDILRNIPPPAPGTPDSQLKTYSSPGTVSHVLELPADAASQLGIEVSSEIITTDPTL